MGGGGVNQAPLLYPPQLINHNPSTANDINVTNITPKSSPAPISATRSGRLVKLNRKYFGATWESLLVFMYTFSLCTQFPVDYSRIQKYLDRRIEPKSLVIMAQGSISMADSCNPDTTTLEKAMAQSYR